MKPYELLNSYYPKESLAASFLIPHSTAVAEFAVQVGERIGSVDLSFIYEAALVHDIGILHTHAPGIGCNGTAPYIQHGILGESLLNSLGYKRHASVCRTHVGVALTGEYITENRLPLPPIDMIPHTEEERIIAYADKFFSKRKEWLQKPKPVDIVIQEMKRFGETPVNTFKKWHERYE